MPISCSALNSNASAVLLRIMESRCRNISDYITFSLYTNIYFIIGISGRIHNHISIICQIRICLCKTIYDQLSCITALQIFHLYTIQICTCRFIFVSICCLHLTIPEIYGDRILQDQLILCIFIACCHTKCICTIPDIEIFSRMLCGILCSLKYRCHGIYSNCFTICCLIGISCHFLTIPESIGYPSTRQCHIFFKYNTAFWQVYITVRQILTKRGCHILIWHFCCIGNIFAARCISFLHRLKSTRKTPVTEVFRINRTASERNFTSCCHFLR